MVFVGLLFSMFEALGLKVVQRRDMLVSFLLESQKNFSSFCISRCSIMRRLDYSCLLLNHLTFCFVSFRSCFLVLYNFGPFGEYFVLYISIWVGVVKVFINHTSCFNTAGSEFSEDNFVAKVKMEIVVSKDQVLMIPLAQVLFQI